MISLRTTTPLLQLRSIGLDLGGRVILRDVKAEILKVSRPGCTQGQVVGLIGPSGIGKTQLFKIIAGLQAPTRGTVLVDTPPVPVHRGLVGVVHQDYPLFEHRTVTGNLLLAARQASRVGAEVQVLAMLDRFQLRDRRHAYPAELSGGQRQRTAIAQQLLCGDHLILMDEPFSGLDLVMEEEVCRLIAELAAADNLNTIVVVTHDITAAATVADTLWLMGRERDAAGAVVPGARIVQTYDLIERDLAWHPEIALTPAFTDFVREVKARFRTL